MKIKHFVALPVLAALAVSGCNTGQSPQQQRSQSAVTPAQESTPAKTPDTPAHDQAQPVDQQPAAQPGAKE